VTDYKVARRSFLAASGASALLYPLLRNLEAQAQGAPAPLRFLIIHHPLGTTLDRWRPTATATTQTFTLPELSAPFEPLRQYMVLIDGVNIVCGNTGDKTHEGGLLAVMTGTPSLGRVANTQQDHASSSQSIDQLFLSRSPLLGGPAAPATDRTPRGSLQLAADIRSDRNEVSPRVLSYRPSLASGTDLNARRQPMFPTTQPLTVYNDYFANIMTGTGGSGGGGGSAGADMAAALLAQRRSVLDFMRRDLTRMQTLVPADQKVKLDVYADSIRQLETTIIGTGMGGAGGSGTVTPPSVCMKPAAPPLFTESGMTDPMAAGGATTRGVDQYVPGQPTAHPHQDVGRLHLSLIKTAFACDLARVATFMWSPGTNHVVFPGLLGGAQMRRGSPLADVQASSHHPPSHDNNASSNAWIAQVDKWYNQQTAEAIQEFRAQTDVDGTNLLENTVIVYVTEVARAPDHDFRNAPWAVFGGANTRVAGGTFLKATGGPLAPISGGTTGNRPINDVWLALAPAFGINDLTALGTATGGIQNGMSGFPMSTGPLPGVLKP
jgi:hypothetical protein